MEKFFNNKEVFVWEQNASPLLLALTLPDIKGLKEWFNIGQFTTIVIFEKYNQAKWIFRKNECKLMGNKIVDALKSPQYRENYERAIKQSEKKLLDKIAEIENNNSLYQLNLEEITKLFKELEEIFYNYFKYTVLVEPIEWYTEEKLKKYIDELQISAEKKKEMLQSLLKIDENSFSYEIISNLSDCALALEDFFKENKDILDYKKGNKILAEQIIQLNSRK